MNWNIDINNISLGGFAPTFYKETYPSFGNKNQAGAMANMDLTNTGFMTQGPGLTTFTNGTEAGAVTGLIRSFFYNGTGPSIGGVPAVGGTLFHLFSSGTTITNGGGTYPHTITGVSGGAEDVVLYGANYYYTWNAVTTGNIGKFNLSVFDDDWGSTVPTGAGTLGSDSHQLKVGGNNTMYIANGRYVSSYDGTTLVLQALDLPTNYVISSIAWHADRLWIAANRGASAQSGAQTDSSIFVWDGTTDSWDVEIKLQGEVGALYVKSGILYTFYKDVTSTGGFKIALLNGNQVVDLGNFTGAIPAYYQVTDYKDFIVWVSSTTLWAYGSGDKDLPARVFQYADGGYSTVGGIGMVFGNLAVASKEDTNYKVAYLSNYDVNSSWKSLMFDITGSGRVSKINQVRINHEMLSTGARVDWKLLNNKGGTIYSDHISYDSANTLKTTSFYPLNGLVAENFRIEFDFASGSTTNPVKIKNAKITGTVD